MLLRNTVEVNTISAFCKSNCDFIIPFVLFHCTNVQPCHFPVFELQSIKTSHKDGEQVVRFLIFELARFPRSEMCERTQCVPSHIILLRAARLRERGTAAGTLQGETETQRYWCPVMQFLFALFKCGRTAPHRGDATRDATMRMNSEGR